MENTKEIKNSIEEIIRNPKLTTDLPSYILFNKKYLLMAIKKNPEIFKFIPEEIKSNKRIAFEAIKQNKENFKYLPESLSEMLDNNNQVKSLSDILLTEHDFLELKTDSEKKEFVLENIKSNPELVKFIPSILENDYNYALELANLNGKVVKFYPKSFLSDKDIALAAVSSNGTSIKFLDKNLQQNREVVLTAIVSNPDAFNYSTKEMQKNKDFIVSCLRINPLALEFINEKFKDDEGIINNVLLKKPEALIYASDRIKTNDILVAKALSSNGNILEHLPESIKNNIELVNIAYTNNPLSYQFASNNIKSEKGNSYWRTIENPQLIFTLPNEMLADSQFVNEVSQSAKNKNLFDEHFRTSLLQIAPTVVIDDIAEFTIGQRQDQKLQRSKSIFDILPLLKSNPEIILTLDKNLLTSEDAQRKVIEANPKTIFFLGEGALLNANLVTAAYNKALDNELDATIFRDTLIASTSPQIKEYCEQNANVDQNKSAYIVSDKFAKSQEQKSLLLNRFRDSIKKSQESIKPNAIKESAKSPLDKLLDV